MLGEDARELARAETGHIFFSGVAPIRYNNAPDMTVARTSVQGWQSYGDVGYVDRNGYLFLTDRLDDMIISGGVSIDPQEPELALAEMPEMREAAVLGVADDAFCERPVAFGMPQQPDDPAVLTAAIDYCCLERLCRIKRRTEVRLPTARKARYGGAK